MTSKIPFAYIASPYSENSQEIVLNRVFLVEKFTAWLIKSKLYYPVSPIAHWHNTSTHTDLPTDAKSWADYNFALQSQFETTIVLMLDGWLESEGVQQEIDDASNLCHSVLYAVFDPEKETYKFV